MSYIAQYNTKYTSFSGSDIVATINDKVVGELQAISYSVTREKTPIYTMGSPDPISFSRGKRGIAGSMVFTVFNKDAFSFMTDPDIEGGLGQQIYTAYANTRPTLDTDGNPALSILSVEEWEQAFDESGSSGPTKNFKRTAAYYTDEIYPFDVTITLHNEYGNAARFSIMGCEILNEGSGMSIDDISTEKACTFVARTLSPLKPVFGAGSNRVDNQVSL